MYIDRQVKYPLFLSYSDGTLNFLERFFFPKNTHQISRKSMQREPHCSILTGMTTLTDALRYFAQRAYYNNLVILKLNMTTMCETKEHNLFIIYKVKNVVCVCRHCRSGVNERQQAVTVPSHQRLINVCQLLRHGKFPDSVNTF